MERARRCRATFYAFRVSNPTRCLTIPISESVPYSHPTTIDSIGSSRGVRLLVRASILAVILGLVSLLTIAKHSPYLPKSNPAHNLSKASKVTESPGRLNSDRARLRECPQRDFRTARATPAPVAHEIVRPLCAIPLDAEQLRSPPTV